MIPEILGVGEVCIDYTSVVDYFPEADEKLDACSQACFSGGVTANYCVATARLGAKTSFFGAVGDDDFGEYLIKEFQKENVDTSYLVKKKGKDTAVNFIVVNKQNGEKFIIQSPCMRSTAPEQVDFNDTILEGVKLVHSTAIYPELTRHIFQQAQNLGILTSLDLEKQIAIWGINKLKPILDHVDILLPNKAGAMQLTNTKTPLEAAQVFLDWGIELVVITLGEKGAVAFTPKESIKVPAFKVPVIDTTGAGDTFCGAFTYTYGIKKWSIKRALQFSIAAASLKIQHLGARSGMPTFQQVEAFLNGNNACLD
ncbi:MAG: carbohydrate kinase family protein [Promethearchaeota archaeon]